LNDTHKKLSQTRHDATCVSRFFTKYKGARIAAAVSPIHDSRTPATAKAVVPCQNKIILKNFRPEPPPSVDRPKIIFFQHGTTSKIILKNFRLLQCFVLTWNHVWNEIKIF